MLLRLKDTHLRTFHKSEPPCFARDHGDWPLHLTQVLIDVVLDEVLDEGGFAHPRGPMHHHHKGWGLLGGCVHHRHCTRQLLSQKMNTTAAIGIRQPVTTIDGAHLRSIL